MCLNIIHSFDRYTVTITGTYFEETRENNLALFEGSPAKDIGASPTSLIFTTLSGTEQSPN
jgi:hypothetical protein